MSEWNWNTPPEKGEAECECREEATYRALVPWHSADGLASIEWEPCCADCAEFFYESNGYHVEVLPAVRVLELLFIISFFPEGTQ